MLSKRVQGKESCVKIAMISADLYQLKSLQIMTHDPSPAYEYHETAQAGRIRCDCFNIK